MFVPSENYAIVSPRPYELIAVATEKGIAIWVIGTNPDRDGRLSVERVALLCGHQGEVITSKLLVPRGSCMITNDYCFLCIGVATGMGHERDDIGEYGK